MGVSEAAVVEEPPRAAEHDDQDLFEDAVDEASATEGSVGGGVAEVYRRLAADARAWSLDDALRRGADGGAAGVAALRAWCRDTAVQADVPDALLVAFLHSCHGDLEQAKTVLRIYDSVRAATPEVFAERAFRSEEVQRAQQRGYSCLLPKKTPEGFRILLQRLRDPDPATFVYSTSSKFQFLTMDAAVRADPTAAGYVSIFDMKSVQMSRIWAWGIRLPRKLFKYMQEGLPLRMQRIHFFNSTPMMDRVMRMLRPLMSKGLEDILYFHTAEDTERIFKMIPRDCLPENYGGYLPSLDKLQDLTNSFIEEMEPLLQV